MADALAGPLDQAGRIRQERAVGELEVDPARVRDEREEQVAHLHRATEGEQGVPRVELDHDVRQLPTDDRIEGAGRSLNLRRVAGEQLVPRLRPSGAAAGHGPTRAPRG